MSEINTGPFVWSGCLESIRIQELPYGWKELNQGEFAGSRFFLYGFDEYGYQQLWWEKRGKKRLPRMLAIKWFWQNSGTGFALESRYDKAEFYDPTYEFNLHMYQFGCDHSNTRELGGEECKKRGIQHWGMCWHVCECNVCGWVQSYDTSG